MKLTDQDKTLLRILQQDASLSNQDLAARAGMSASSCWRRVKAMQDAGVIRGHVLRINPGAVGLAFHAMVSVHLQRHDPGVQQEFVNAIMDRPEVLTCVALTGGADYNLQVFCTDQAAYYQFLEDFLFRVPGVNNVRTNLVLKTIKDGTELPIV